MEVVLRVSHSGEEQMTDPGTAVLNAVVNEGTFLQG